MRILHLTTDGDHSGGVTSYLTNLAQAQSKRGHEVIVLGSAEAVTESDSGFSWQRYPGSLSFSKIFSTALAISRLPKFDVIHAHYRKAALLGRVIAWRQSVPLIFTLHLTGIPMHFPYRLLSDFGDFAHSPSIQATQWLESNSNLEKNNIFYIPHGIDCNAFSFATECERESSKNLLNLDPNKKTVSYIGRFDNPKNEHWIPELARLYPYLQFVMMGSGPRRSDITSKDVIIMPESNPSDLMRASDLLLLPSSLEGFSLVCAEAMAIGTPVLRTRTAGCEEMIIEGKTGFSCDPTKESFFSRAAEVFERFDDLENMRSPASLHIQRTLSFDRQIESTERMYQTILENY